MANYTHFILDQYQEVGKKLTHTARPKNNGVLFSVTAQVPYLG